MLLVAVAMLWGCAGTAEEVSSINPYDSQLAKLDAQAEALAAKEAELDNRARMLEGQMKAASTAEANAYSAQARALESSRQQQGAAFGDTSLFPPKAEAGSCYARVLIPAQFKTTSETVVKREAGEKIEIIPARYQTVKEQVLVSEASQRLETIPAKFGYVEEKVMVVPATQRMVEVPATQRIDEATGEIMCLVDVPAEYRTVTKRVVKTPATTRMIEKPAEFKTVKKRVMTEAPQTRMVEIPAEYKTIQVTKLVTPTQEKRVPIPADYQTVTKKVKTSEEHMEWREILCDTNMTSGKISQIQQALMKAGFNPGPIDGVIGARTMSAVNAFQKDKNLLVSNYLTMNTVKALGINP